MRTLPALLLLAVAAHAGVVHVPADVASLQDAVDAANDGDEIVVAAGLYEETLLIDSKDFLTVRGQGQVILHGGDATTPTITVIDCTNVTLERIGFEQSAFRAVHVEQSEGIRLSRCRMDGSAGEAVHLLDSTGTVIERCLIQQPAGVGIVVEDCAATLVSQCRIEEAGASAIRISGGSGTSVERCKLVAPEQFGIAVGDPVGSPGCVLLRNQVLDPGDGGLKLAGALSTARENKILRPGSVGIRVDAGGAGSILEDNLIVQPLDDGLDIFGANSVVRGNRIVKAGGLGVVADVSGLTLTDNIVVAPFLVGVQLQSGVSSGTVARNRVQHSEQNGFEIGSSGVLVLENQALGCGGDGFLVSNGPNQIAHNLAKGSGASDLEDISALSNSYFDNSFSDIPP